PIAYARGPSRRVHDEHELAGVVLGGAHQVLALFGRELGADTAREAAPALGFPDEVAEPARAEQGSDPDGRLGVPLRAHIGARPPGIADNNTAGRAGGPVPKPDWASVPDFSRRSDFSRRPDFVDILNAISETTVNL